MITTPSDILGPLGDAILEGTEDNMPEFTVVDVDYLDRSGRVIDPQVQWTETEPTTMVVTTATGARFKLTIEAATPSTP